MGCDGGTIPRRDELVKVKGKPETKDKASELSSHWNYCHLSQQPLQSPIVICGLGFIYNKMALIEGLLDRSSLPEGVRHIKSLKDVKNLNLTRNPEYKATDEMKEGSVDIRAAQYICPVIGLEMTGKYRFIALWSCGCVFSERALKEIGTNVCHKCQKPFVESDVVILNGNEEDLLLMRSNMENRQQKQKSKKVKPSTITSEEQSATDTPSTSATVTKVDDKGDDVDKATSDKQTIPQAPPVKIFKNIVSRKRKVSETGLKRETKKAKGNYSVAKDPNATDVYKSLFTTHQSERKQNRAHWVTYNPFYN